MADDVQAGAAVGSGPVFATDKDEVNNRHYSKIKLVFGPNDTFTDVTASAGLPITVLNVVPGFTASDLGKRVDDPATTSDVGVALLAKRTGTPANFSGTDGDYEPLQISSGRLHTSTQAVGTVAHDGVDSGNPIKIGGKANSSAPTAVSASGDRVDAWFDLNGRLVVLLDQPIPAGTNAIGKLAANSGVDIGDVDVTSVLPGVGANNLGKAEDSPHASGDVGVMMLAVRSDTATQLAGTDGDYSPLLTDANGRLHVNVGNTLTVGTHAVTQSGGWTVSVTGSLDTELTTADLDTGAGTDTRAVVGLVLAESGGGILVGSANPLPISLSSGTLTSIGTSVTPGTGAAHLGKAEDAAHASGDTGVMALAVRKDTATSLADTDGDYLPLIVDANGRLHVNVGNTVTISGNVTNAGAFAVQATVAAGATNIAKAEDDASANADVGVPAMAVRKATPANTSGTDGDYEMLQMSAGRLWVDASGVTLTVGSHAVTNAGTFAVQDSEKITDDSAFTVATSKVQPAGYMADETSTDSVDEGDAGIARMTLDRKQIVTPQPHTKGGLTPYKLVSAATTNATSVKASAGQVYEIFCSNVNAAVRYLKLYDKASAPTVGTDTPVWTLAIPGNTAGAGFAKSIPVGLQFSNGIAFALTTEATDAGTTAVAANEIVVNLGYV